MDDLLDDLFHEDNKEFETVWISENVHSDYGASKRLPDEKYIEYKVWENQNWKNMYKTHLPNTTIVRGDNPNLIFHGGCLGCLSQRNHGTNRCIGCMYFKFDNSKPNLFIKGEDSAKMSGDDLKDLLN